MPHRTTSLTTPDGQCPLHVFTPAGAAPWPGVILYMDGLGVRPALFEIAERLAAPGYCVVVPDLYYRSGFTDGPKVFSDPEVRAFWSEKIVPTVSIARIMSDLPALLAWMDASPDVAPGPFGVVGYCLGGRMALSAAGRYPDRFAAAASYHGSQLATDAPDSPHRLAPAMQARVYVAGAIEDRGFDDAQKQRLEEALTAAGVDHVVETYQARHGWVPSDTPVHDEAATARHWDTLLRLFDESLGQSAPTA